MSAPVQTAKPCTAVMDLLAVLSAAGVRRSLVHAAAGEGLPGRDGPLPALAPEAADRVLARLAGTSLLTFSLDGSAVTAHRLVMRVIRENLAADDALTAVCESAARLLDGLAASLRENWHEDRAATRDLVEQIMALDESAARCPPGSDLDRRMIGLQAVGSPVLEPSRRQRGAGHRDRRAAGSCQRTRPGPGPPRHPDLAQQPRHRLPGRGPPR